MPPLAPQAIPILFGKLDTKTAPRLVQQGSFVELTNVQMTQQGRVQKRPGYSRLAAAAGAAEPFRRMAIYGNKIIAQAIGSAYVYTSGSGTMSAIPGTLGYAQPSIEMVTANVNSQSVPDMAIGGGYELVVWEDNRSSGQIRYSVRNATTGEYVVSDQLFVGSGSGFQMPKVVYSNGYFLVVYMDSGIMKVKTVSATTPTAIQAAPVTLVTPGAGPVWDIAVRGVDELVLAWKDGGSNLSVWIYSIKTLAAGTGTAFVQKNAVGGVTVGSCLGWLTGGNADGNMYLGVGTTTSALMMKIDASTTLVETTTLESAITAPTQITGAVDTSVSPTQRFVTWQKPGASSKTINDQIGRAFSTSSGDNVTISAYMRSVGLASRAFWMDGQPHVVATYEGGQNTTAITNIQQTYLVVNLVARAVVGRVLSQLGGGMRARASTLTSGSFTPPGSTTRTTSVPFTCALLRKTQSATENSATVLIKSVARVTFSSFADISSPRAVGFGLVFAGGAPSFYDGVSVTELGFHVYPEMAAGMTVSATASTMSGVYSYIYVYNWFDSQGQRHQSAPSVSVSTPTVTSKGVDHVIPTYRLGQKSNVLIEIYRKNPGADTNYYKVTSTVSPLLNDATVDTVSYTDTLADTEAAKREVLYTAGGVLPNDPPPPARIVALYKDRLALTGQDFTGRIWMSKPIVDGDAGPMFTGEFELTADPTDGDPTALAQLDDKAVIMFKQAIAYFTGDGPDASNKGGDWSSIVRLAGATGAAGPNVARVQEGLAFASSNSGGIYLLDRGLTVSYRGADVESFNGLALSSAIVLPDINQTRFTTATGTMLVRDDYYQRWYTWTNQAAVDACEFNGRFTWLASDGSLYQETPGAYLDNGAPIQSRITLAWIRPFGVGGTGRLWRVHVVGDYQTGAKLLLGIRYDDTDAVVWEQLLADEGAAGTVYGSGTYGAGTYGGSSAGDMRFEARPAQQRCSSFQLIVTDIDSGSTGGAGMDLSSMAVLVGVQPGALAQLPASRQMVKQ